MAPRRPHAATVAVGWYNRLLRVGVRLPLFLVHDLGWLLAAPPSELLRLTPPPTANRQQQGYAELLAQLSRRQTVAQLAALSPGDELVTILLASWLGSLSRRFTQSTGALAAEPLPLDRLPDPAAALGQRPPQVSRRWGSDFLDFLLQPPQLRHLQTALELLDVPTLRLLSLGAGGSTAATDRQAISALAVPDLLAAFTTPEVRDVVRFSLDLLPSLLETRRRAGSQSYPVGGYTTLERRGSLDSVLASELASDDDLLFARLLESELLYYGRERRPDEQPAAHQILIDASASMRGLRQVFARGLAIALAKRLSLLGTSVRLRFFDGRLHEAVSLGSGSSGGLPYLLSFRSERGRNYRRVFADLLRELRQPSGALPATTTVHLLTHGECHIPLATVRELTARVALHGVFVLPSGGLDLEYLSLLRHHQVVSDEILAQPELRRRHALGIVAALSGEPSSSP